MLTVIDPGQFGHLTGVALIPAGTNELLLNNFETIEHIEHIANFVEQSKESIEI